MAASSRTSQFTKLHKILKKHYQPVAPDDNRSVFEQLIFACCLENARADHAESAYAALIDPTTGNFFDWNEVRVSTVRELSEAMADLPDPPAAANRVKRVLQSIFESTYSFDLEDLRKQNLGPAVEHLKKLDGTTNFTVAYVTQTALGGHAIPVDAGTLQALSILGLVTEEDVRNETVPGLDRAIPKNKGPEFASLLHQLGADVFANPHSPAVHKILLEIDPEARQRLPKRSSRKHETPPIQAGEAPAPQQPVGPEKKAPGRKAKSPKEAPADRAAEPEARSSPEAEPPKGGKKRRSASRKTNGEKGPASDLDDPPQAEDDVEKSASSGLSRRKPR
jgi:endonuclease-3